MLILGYEKGFEVFLKLLILKYVCGYALAVMMSPFCSIIIYTKKYKPTEGIIVWISGSFAVG